MLGNGSRTRWGVAEQIAAAGEAFSRFKVDKKQRYLVDGRDSRSQGKRQRYFHTPCLYLTEGKAAGESSVRAAHSNNLFRVHHLVGRRIGNVVVRLDYFAVSRVDRLVRHGFTSSVTLVSVVV